MSEWTPERVAAMTNEEVRALDDEDLLAYAKAGGSLGPVMGQRAFMYTPTEDPGPMPDPDSVPMALKSLRIPVRLYDELMEVKHPQGLSGLLREAAQEWLERHRAGTAEAEFQQAARVVARYAERMNREVA